VTFDEVVAELTEAIRVGYREQQELVRVTDLAFDYLAEHDATLANEQVMELRILLAQAETMIGRYFGT
jgi:hypothetical protein